MCTGIIRRRLVVGECVTVQWLTCVFVRTACQELSTFILTGSMHPDPVFFASNGLPGGTETNKTETLPHPVVPSFALINFASYVLQMQGCNDDFCGLKVAK